jgi:hypothetical protein
MNFSTRHMRKILLAVAAIAATAHFLTQEEEKVLVSTVAVHYFPPHHRVEKFYVDGFYSGDSNFRGLAGMGLCCVWIPEQLRPGLVVDVGWSVTDWSQLQWARKTTTKAKLELLGTIARRSQLRNTDRLAICMYISLKVEGARSSGCRGSRRPL